jgi:intein-encoded DNA endonuclease-like protein
MKITPKTKQKVINLREDGLSYAKIAKSTKISKSSVVKILKKQSPSESEDKPKQDEFIQAKILKTCPNPRIIYVYFDNDRAKFAKCVVRAGMNYPRDKTMTVKRVDESAEEIYRAV